MDSVQRKLQHRTAWILYDFVSFEFMLRVANDLIYFPARVLRLLATHHIFVEPSPDVFKNNRLSSLMDTTKSVENIKAK
jgi:hypothetical protein